MRETVSEEMKQWVINFIRTRRNDGCISLHVVFSGFNLEFGKMFRTDPRAAIGLMIESGFLKGEKARKGFSIWLPEDEGKGRGRPFRSRVKVNKPAVKKNEKSADTQLTTEVNQIQPEVLAEQTGGDEMSNMNAEGMDAKMPYQISTINPETGKGDDLIATARAATKLLHTHGVVDAAGRCLATISPDKILTEAGFTTSTLHLILFLDRMGLVRKLYKKGDVYCYLVLDPDFLDLIVTPKSVTAVLKQMRERRQLQDAANELKKLQHPETGELTLQKARITKLEAQVLEVQALAQPVSDGSTLEQLEQLAEAAVIAETLAKERDEALTEVGSLRILTESLQVRVAVCERKLKEQSTADDLMARMRAKLQK